MNNAPQFDYEPSKQNKPLNKLGFVIGDPIYEAKARSAVDYLWSRRQRSSDLMGTVLNVENGEWIR